MRTSGQKRRKRRLEGLCQCANAFVADLVPREIQLGDRAIGLVVFDAWSAMHRKHVDDCHSESREL